MKISERFAKLIDVKSIVTILLAGIFAYLSITGKITEQGFQTIFTMIISFYFGTQSVKKLE